MKKIILHIGTTKTGTSSLQTFFSENRKTLHNNNIGYFIPSTNYDPYGTTSNGHILNAVIFNNLQLPENERTDILLKNPTLDNNRLSFNDYRKQQLPIDTQNLKEYARNYDTLVFSEEMIYHHQIYYDNYWQEIRKYFDEVIDEEYQIQIVIYYRRQDEWILSEWKQMMLTEIPNTMKFHEFLRTYEKIGYLNYYDNVKKMAEVFGKENIFVRSYEKGKLINNNIICDFVDSFLGFDYSNLNTEFQTNRSISTTCAYAINYINRGKVKIRYNRQLLWGFCHRPFSDYINDIEDSAMSVLEKKLLLRKYRAQNKQLAEEYNNGIDLFNNNIKKKKVVRANCFRDRKNALKIDSLIHEYYR